MGKKKANGKMTISLGEMSQEVNLKSYLGHKPSASEKRAFAEIAMATIEERTLDGDTVNGTTFKKYSKAYADFKGVTRDSVDLFLHGDMLDSIGRRTSKEKRGTVFLQMKKGKQTKKAYNHNTGDTVTQREFFGITDAEAKRIADEVKEAKAQAKSESKPLNLAFLRDTLDLLDIEQTDGES